MIIFKAVVSFMVFSLIHALAYDDGKYRPEQDDTNANGKYYRPLSEGQYIRNDEGKYTYIYRQGLYPGDDGDYRYIHDDGLRGHDGSPGIPGGFYVPDKTYAEKYKHLKLDSSLLDKHIPYSYFDNNYDGEQSENYFETSKDSKIIKDKDGMSCQELCDRFNFQNKEEYGNNLLPVYTLQEERNITIVSEKSQRKYKVIYNIFVKVLEYSEEESHEPQNS